MFCTNCGNPVPDGARFCEQCGATVPQPVTQPTNFAPYAPTPVAEPTPVAMPEAVAAPAKKKKNPLPLILILAVVVIAAVVAAVLLLLGKQTVYLATEIVSENMNGPVTTQRYEYDDEGRITKYEYEIEYPEEYEYSFDTKYEVSYEYDDEGNLESAAFEADDTSIEIEYIYKKGVLTGFECTDLDELNTAEIEVECDDDGRFEYIAFLDEDGEENFVWEFKYHDNGVVKESRRTFSYNNMETISRYNEDGKNIETTMSWDGEQQYRTVTDYDDRGNMTLQKQYDSEDELTMSWEIEYTYKKDQLVGLIWNIEGQDSDGETIEAEISFECEWDGLECTLTIDEIDGDEDALSSIGLGDEDIEILFEKDKHGNTLKTEICVDGEAMTSSTTEYEEFKVSRDYREPNLRTDPLYLLFLIM